MSNRPNRPQHRRREAPRNRDLPTISVDFVVDVTGEEVLKHGELIVVERCPTCAQRYEGVVPCTPFLCGGCDEWHYEGVLPCPMCDTGDVRFVVPVGDRRLVDDGTDVWGPATFTAPPGHPVLTRHRP